MSGSGAPKFDVKLTDAKIAIAASSWHEQVMSGLIAGAERALAASGVEFDVHRVPGAFELPLACQTLVDAGYDGVVALGVVIRGGTPHFDFVCRAATDGIFSVSLGTGVPIGFGLLTCDNEQQALDRAGLPGSSEDKGAEAAEATLAMLALLRKLL